MMGAAVRFYVVCIILQRFVFDPMGVPFVLTVVGMVLLIWLYTRHGGIKTLVWTDSFQTLCLFVALLLIIYKVLSVNCRQKKVQIGGYSSNIISAHASCRSRHSINKRTWRI